MARRLLNMNPLSGKPFTIHPSLTFKLSHHQRETVLGNISLVVNDQLVVPSLGMAGERSYSFVVDLPIDAVDLQSATWNLMTFQSYAPGCCRGAGKQKSTMGMSWSMVSH